MFPIDAQPFSNATPISRVRFHEVTHLSLLNILGRIPQAPHNVADQSLLLVWLHQPEEISRRRVVIIIQTMIVAIDGSRNRPRALAILGIFFGSTEAVGLVV